MGHYFIELLIWMPVAYFLGCLLGCLFRRLFGAEPARVVEAPVVVAAAASPAAAAAAAAPVTAEPVAPVAVATGLMERPQGIAAARNGKADDLQRISGIGPKNEKVLHGLGFFHFDQIATWTADQVRWVDDHLKFNGRIQREEWIRQARLLAEGNEAEFARLYGTGGMKNAEGEQVSGSRTRRT